MDMAISSMGMMVTAPVPSPSFRSAETIGRSPRASRSRPLEGSADLWLAMRALAASGLAYKFNRRGFVRASNVQPVDVTPYLDRIRNLEENNTDLASKNSVLNDENEKLRNAPAKVVVEQKVSASPVVLFFRIGKATLDSKELTNLEFYVRNAMKLDSDKTFTLIGSADKDTGNRELNQRLSEQRMEYVYDLLKNKYGVAPERLVRKAEGDTNNRFAEPELNRAVIVE